MLSKRSRMRCGASACRAGGRTQWRPVRTGVRGRGQTWSWRELAGELCVIGKIDANFGTVVLNDEEHRVWQISPGAQLERRQKGLEVVPAFAVDGPATELMATL